MTPTDAIFDAARIISELDTILDNSVDAIKLDLLNEEMSAVERLDAIDERVSELYVEASLRIKRIHDALRSGLSSETPPKDAQDIPAN